MAASTTSSSSPAPAETVLEGFEFSEANNILLMALMEETQEDEENHDLYYADDDRLISMIQSLEAEIRKSSSSHQIRCDDNDIDHHHVGQVDGQDFSTSVSTNDHDWMEMEVASASSSTSSPFDEEMESMGAWSPYAAGGDDCDYSEMYHGVLLDNSFFLP